MEFISPLAQQSTFDEWKNLTTIKNQIEIEQEVKLAVETAKSEYKRQFTQSEALLHANYIRKQLGAAINCNGITKKCWYLYWTLNSLDVLGQTLDPDEIRATSAFLRVCQDENGGFGGDPGEPPHMGSTYAAICAICILGKYSPEAYEIVNTDSLKMFIFSCYDKESGSFRMSPNDEVCVRASYLAIASLELIGQLKLDYFPRAAEHILSCQSYEGGFSSNPFNECHMGYTFSSVAALDIMGSLLELPQSKLYSIGSWLLNRQMRYAGGFQGRIAKLVDSCYSYWSVASIHAINDVIKFSHIKIPPVLYDPVALYDFIMICCRNSTGGFGYKQEVASDIYHSCYCISALSMVKSYIATYYQLLECDSKFGFLYKTISIDLKPIDPVLNVTQETLNAARKYFQGF